MVLRRFLIVGFLFGLFLVEGCAGITVRKAAGPSVTESLRISAVTGTDLSARSHQTLRRFDLGDHYPGRIAEAVAALHTQALRDPHPDVLFALAELNYLRGCQAERKAKPEAYAYYYLSAGYAYHYLFDTYPPQKTEIRRVGNLIPIDTTPTEAFDPRFRLACDIYNAGLAKCLVAAQRCGQFDPRRQLIVPTEDQSRAITLAVVHKGFAFKPDEFGPVQLCSDYQVVGLANQNRTFGLGVPLIGSRAVDAPPPPHKYHPVRGNFPITAFFRFEGTLAELNERRAGWLEFVNPMTVQKLDVRGKVVPLETDLTTPLAYFLSHAGLERAGLNAFFRPDSLGTMEGLHPLEPYQPGKIPVVLVHGLLSSPLTWAPMFNDLQADPTIRTRYQFWVYFYPTSNPYLLTASQLRQELQEVRRTVDPTRQDSALDEMVLVGHSMGGLISRLLTINGGDDFWKLVSTSPFDRLELKPEHRTELRNTFYFEPQNTVRRAIFLGTPHHGSRLSPSILGRIAVRLAGIPRTILDITRDIVEDNPDAASTLNKRALPTSVDLLAPDAPALQLIANRPRPPAVQYHSVIGVTPPGTLVVERLLSGTYYQVGDGVVPYTSAHLDSASSEMVVPADHYTVHQHPLAILEVRRILLEHLRDADKRQQTIIPVGAKSAK